MCPQPTDNFRTSRQSAHCLRTVGHIPRSVKVWQGTRNSRKEAGRNSCPFFNYRSGYELPDKASAGRILSVRLQKRMLCARPQPGVAPVDLLCAPTEADAPRAPSAVHSAGRPLSGSLRSRSGTPPSAGVWCVPSYPAIL